MNQKGIEQIKKHEGFRGVTYKCSAKKWTIGYGHNFQDNPITAEQFKLIGMRPDTNLFEVEMNIGQATKLLIYDINKIIVSVNSRYNDLIQTLNEPRAWVLYNMAFNMGVEKLKVFKKFISALENQDYILASHEMLDSVWARQVGNRAKELSLQMKIGEFV